MSNLTKSVVLNYHRIRWISIVGGFMDGTRIEFAPGLNCIIGARGTGKTTVLEFIRFAQDAMPDGREACKRIEALVNRNLDFGRYNLFARGGGGYHFTPSGWTFGLPVSRSHRRPIPRQRQSAPIPPAASS